MPLTLNKKIILATVFALAIFLIVFHFTETPRVWVDEGVFTEVAKNLAWHGVMGLQTAPGQYFPMTNFLTTGYPVIVPVALSLKLLGVGVWPARLPMIIYMFGLVLVSYLFTKNRYGFWPAIFAVLLLLSFSPFYGNGRPVQGEVPGLFFLVLGAWFLLHWEARGFNRYWPAFFSGLCLGLAMTTKPIYLLGLFGALVVILGLWFRRVSNKKTLLIFILGLAIPLIAMLLIQFPGLRGVDQLIPTYLHLAGNHDSAAPLGQTVLGNFLRFFTETTPILFLFLLLAAGSFGLSRWFKFGIGDFTAAEVLIFIFIILNWLAYLPGTGWYRYFFPANALLYLFLPPAVFGLAQVANRPWIKRLIIAGLAGLVILQFGHLIFLSDTAWFGDWTRNQKLAAALGGISPSQTVLFYGSVEAAIFLNSANYYQYIAVGDFLLAGNQDLAAYPKTDFILSDRELKLTCYKEILVSRYYFSTKIKNCDH